MGAWGLLVTAVLQAVGPLWAGFDQGRPDNPVVVPPGPFFAVWGLVLLGCLVVAVRGLGRAGDPGFRRLHVPLTVAQVGFVLWLVFAARVPVLTVPVFVLMLVMLVIALRRAPARAGSDQVLVEAVLGVYAGWSAAAVWLNVATVLDRPSSAVLAGLLSGAVVSTLVLIVFVCRTAAARIAAGVTGAWALLGVTLSASAAGSAALAALAAVGGVAVVVVVVVGRRLSARGSGGAV
ncbi:hypothetical protein BJP25_19170 [Actinokineospora bangkokensis]|uniref:Tryptophan-rich sensory protein n=1 Tax=Actinokineospora bangkokensis TaxID=1193682 RepID=A0A1Q9LM52_9PSEU|nr:hypothetical protein BJP25_19170 [Actinokineospora bangkokensis]